MKTRLLLLALPGALALGLIASAQSVHHAAQPEKTVKSAQPLTKPSQPDPPAVPAPRARKPSQPGAPVAGIPPALFPPGEAVGYCTSTPNSTGARAMVGCANNFSVCQNQMCLSVFDVPADVTGLFFYGGKPTQVPMANGFLCVSPFHPGLYRLPTVKTDIYNSAHLQLDFPTLPAAGKIKAGSTWYFQFWFRDPLAGGAGSNFSDGVKITFCP